MSGRGPNPYVGPRSFRAGERLYGRDREIDALYHQLLAERIVLLYSPSGAGKSSLIQAGLIPRLAAEGFRVRPPIRVGTEPPPGAPAGASRFVQAALLSLDDDGELVPGATLAGTLAEQRARAGVDAEVLVFDQFEEVLTVEPSDVAAKLAFFRELGAALKDDACWAVLAMREDFIAGLDPYRSLVPHRLRSTFRLDLLGLDAAIAAIRSPAEAAGVAFAEPAARQLAEDLAQVKVQRIDGSVDARPGNHVEPVQLQVVCNRLWDRLPAEATAIGMADVRALGDVDDALAGFYDAQIAAATSPATPERALRGWIERNLVTPQGLRTQVLQTPETTLELANAALWRLVDAHLLRTDSRRGMIWFELAHDRMVAPMRRSNAAWLQRHTTPIQQHAALWHAQGRPDGLLLQDRASLPPLDAADVTPLEQAFIAGSRAAIARAARLRKYRRWAVLFAAVTFVVVTAGLIGGFIAYDKYQDGKRRTAEREASDRAAQAAAALGRQLNAQALLWADQQPDLAALLALATTAYNTGWARSAALLAVVTRAPQLVDRISHTAEVARVAADAKGDLVFLDADGRLFARPAGGGRTRPIGDPKLAVAAFATHPTRAEVAFLDPQGQIHEWDVAADRPLRVRESGLSTGEWAGPMNLAYDGSGARLALVALASQPDPAAGTHGELVVHDQADARTLHHASLIAAVTAQFAVASRGDVVVTSGAGGLYVHTVGAAEQRQVLLPDTAPGQEVVVDLALSRADDRLVALTSWQKVWQFTLDGATVGATVEPFVRDGPIEQFALGGGDELAVMLRAADGDGRRVELWSPAQSGSTGSTGSSRQPLGVPILLPPDSPGTLAFVGPERRLVALAAANGAISVFDHERERAVGAGEVATALPPGQTAPDALGTVLGVGVTPFAVHEDPAGAAMRVAIAESRANGEGRVTLARLDAGGLTITRALDGLRGVPRRLLWSPSGRTITAISDAEKIAWDTTSGARTIGPSPVTPPFYAAVAHHGEDLRAATLTPEGAVLVDGAPIPAVPGKIHALAFDPDGEFLAVGACVEDSRWTGGCARSAVTVIDVGRDAVVFGEREATAGFVFSLAVARGGARVAVGGGGGRLAVVRRDGSPLVLPGRRGQRFVEGLAFSADGAVLAEMTATAVPVRAAEVRLWDLVSGEPLVPPWLAHDGRVMRSYDTPLAVAFAGDAALLTASVDGVIAWPLDAAVLRPRVCAAAGRRNFTAAELQRIFGAVLPMMPLCPLAGR